MIVILFNIFLEFLGFLGEFVVIFICFCCGLGVVLFDDWCFFFCFEVVLILVLGFWLFCFLLGILFWMNLFCFIKIIRILIFEIYLEKFCGVYFYVCVVNINIKWKYIILGFYLE